MTTGCALRPVRRVVGPDLLTNRQSMRGLMITWIFRSGDIQDSDWRKIRSIAQKMRERFSWVNESPMPDPYEEEGPTDEPEGSKPPMRALAVTRVDGDYWNALLVIRYMRWVSELLPDAIISIDDDDGYILAGRLVLRGGRMGLDGAQMDRRKDFLRSINAGGKLKELELSEHLAHQYGVYFGLAQAVQFADRKEIQALQLPETEMAHLSIEEVADRIEFPWQRAGA